MENLRGFEVVFLGATNSRGARVRIIDTRFNKTKIISYDYEFNNVGDIAEKFLKGIGIECLFKCELQKGYMLLTKNFNIQIK